VPSVRDYWNNDQELSRAKRNELPFIVIRSNNLTVAPNASPHRLTTSSAGQKQLEMMCRNIPAGVAQEISRRWDAGYTYRRFTPQSEAAYTEADEARRRDRTVANRQPADTEARR
jgi:hypothetical protein